MMCNDQLVYKVVIWGFLAISLWTEKVALSIKGKEYLRIENTFA